MDSLTYETTVPFVPPVTEGRVVKTYDGDTITIATYLLGTAYRFTVRLNGIDTPELKKSSPEEKALAIKARDELHELIYHKVVTLKNSTTEKFGRILADVYLGDVCVNEWMIEKGHAKRYDGGHKEAW
jgi:micrococcal nuclease